MTEPDSAWYPLTRRESFRLSAPIHELWALLRWVGLRDRLRCPSCRAVGTWKPHGSVVERLVDKDISTRRWLCKWCGYYNGPLGRTAAYPSTKTGAWAPLPEPGESRDAAPAEALRAALGKVWPWIG